jgi:hypothetical protein
MHTRIHPDGFTQKRASPARLPDAADSAATCVAAPLGEAPTARPGEEYERRPPLSPPICRRWGEVTAAHGGRHRKPGAASPHRSAHLSSGPFAAVRTPLSALAQLSLSIGPRSCCSTCSTPLAAVYQLQTWHHASLSQGVQRPSFHAIQFDATRRGSEQHGDDAVLAGAATHFTTVTIHDHVRLRLARDLVTTDGRPRH